AMPGIGFLNGASPDGHAPSVAAFRQGLNEGRDGQNATIKYRWAENHYNRLPALAADLVRQKVTVIAATTTPAVLAAKPATSTAPIVFRPGVTRSSWVSSPACADLAATWLARLN